MSASLHRFQDNNIYPILPASLSALPHHFQANNIVHLPLTNMSALLRLFRDNTSVPILPASLSAFFHLYLANSIVRLHTTNKKHDIHLYQNNIFHLLFPTSRLSADFHSHLCTANRFHFQPIRFAASPVVDYPGFPALYLLLSQHPDFAYSLL